MPVRFANDWPTRPAGGPNPGYQGNAGCQDRARYNGVPTTINAHSASVIRMYLLTFGPLGASALGHSPTQMRLSAKSLAYCSVTGNAPTAAIPWQAERPPIRWAPQRNQMLCQHDVSLSRRDGCYHPSANTKGARHFTNSPARPEGVWKWCVSSAFAASSFARGESSLLGLRSDKWHARKLKSKNLGGGGRVRGGTERREWCLRADP